MAGIEELSSTQSLYCFCLRDWTRCCQESPEISCFDLKSYIMILWTENLISVTVR
jgi:hypothetical protein